MENTLHTPGPWQVSPYGNITSKSLTVASVEQIDFVTESEKQANARLIAAAPDLLSALENLMARCVKDAEHYAPDGNEAIWAYISDASDAICKAKGKA
jgi:hypothetical protein